MRPNEPPRTSLDQPTHGTKPKSFDGRVTVTPARPERLLRLPSVEDRTGKRKSSIYAGVKDRSFPAPVRLSARAVAWRESDIDKWIEERTTAGAAS
jgi:prophage regulatory protein